MNEDIDPFVFPYMPDEDVVAIDLFLQAFYNRLPNITSLGCTAGITQAISETHTTIPCRRGRVVTTHPNVE